MTFKTRKLDGSDEFIKSKKTEVVSKVLNDSQNVDTEFLNELKYTYRLWDGCRVTTIQCHGVTQIPETKNYAIILEYVKYGDLHLRGIGIIHYRKILHRDLHTTIKPNISRESQIYGIIPYMAPELFKGQPYSYASDIYYQTEDTPKFWVNLMKRYWHPNPSQQPTIQEVENLDLCPSKYNWLEYNEAEKKTT
ncbi:hypothetical protein Glove_595g9 [Diversispora epigaea]|uniref:Protein kinase domain-containing protein n=1 Tax=Diversispora epigaea TaxID=1348612 RepID=A0A397GC78_9GLOM|nr:hypothetical protein Glove_595g9 [Diversispora epigaea]